MKNKIKILIFTWKWNFKNRHWKECRAKRRRRNEAVSKYTGTLKWTP